MRSAWVPLLALIVAGCGAGAAERQCDALAASIDLSDYVDQRTGKLVRSEDGDVLDPRTGRVVVTRSQVGCIERKAKEAIARYQRGG